MRYDPVVQIAADTKRDAPITPLIKTGSGSSLPVRTTVSSHNLPTIRLKGHPSPLANILLEVKLHLVLSCLSI